MVADIEPATVRESAARGTRALWEDTSGARVGFFLDSRGRVECAKPSFAGSSVLHARADGMRADPAGCRFCALASVEVLEDDDVVYPLLVELDDIHRGPPKKGAALDLSVTAFAESLEVWQDV